MKSILFFVIFILLTNTTTAQNLNFENWIDESIFTPLTDESGLPGIYDCHPYLINNTEQILPNGILFDSSILPDWSANPFGILRTTDAYNGVYAIIVNMWYNGSKGILAFGNSDDVYNFIPKVQFNNKLHGISGHYKYVRDVFIPNDTLNKGALLNIVTYKSDSFGNLNQITHDSLAFNISNTYEPFYLPINYTDINIMPDFVSVWFESKGYSSGTTSCPLSHFLYLDDIEFHFQSLSVKEIILDMKIKIYPNPAKGFINLQYENDISVEKIKLMDISGKIVKTYENKDKSLDTNGLKSGIYILQINTQRGNITKKIILKID